MNELKENISYSSMEDRLTVEYSYDAEPVLDSNKRIKNSTSSKAIQKYTGDFVHAGRMHKGDLQRLINLGYNLLSPDKEEVNRALRYIQDNEPHLMLVHGKPFAKQRVKWA